MKPHSDILSPPTAGPSRASSAFDVQRIRRDFPLLHQQMNSHPLAYLDNAATTQKPQAVIDAIAHYYEQDNANIHRGVYTLSQRATDAYELARKKVQRFINAPDPAQIIFTRGTTEAINLVAATHGRANLHEGDEVLITAMEHHSNIVPWQMICQQTGATLRVVPINDAGELAMDELEQMLSARTKIVSAVHVSNSLGTINDVKTIVRLAHQVGAKVLIDGAQWVAHGPVDVRDLDCDFYAFSGHKLLGPTGIGVLYGKRDLLESMPPYQGGGDMIESVTFEKTTYAPLPNKFEAGTPNIAGAIGLGTAIDYLTGVGFESFTDYEHELLEYATARLGEIPGLRIVGTASRKASVISFVLENPPVSSLDIGSQLDAEGIAIRTGHHCCQPVMERLGITGTARASLAFYNTKEEIDRLAAAIHKIHDTAARRPARGGTGIPPVIRGGTGFQPVIQNRDQDSPATSIAYPQAAAASPQAAADELIELFQFLEDWDERYAAIIEMGQNLLPIPPEYKTEATRVRGCQSIVYLWGRRSPASSDTVEFLADSDADIVKGLIAILQRLYSGQQAKDILEFDVEGLLRQLGLDKYLTTGRRNGLAGMIQRIQSLAANVQQLGTR